jgi:O-acetyl-ADP-ribose deacetylase (regulator of RNase III)
MGADVKEMKIYLLSRSSVATSNWNKCFDKEPNIKVVCSDFIQFMQSTKVECVVSPANSFGLMDGGYDEAITAWFGNQLQKRVQQYIIDELRGEQIVGTSFIIKAGKDNQYLIHTPTMRIPNKILDSQVIYSCMRSCLSTAIDNDIGSIVIPAFGGATGRVSYDVVADLMYKAYHQICNPMSRIKWSSIREL